MRVAAHAGSAPGSPTPTTPAAADPAALLRSPAYLRLLLFATLLGLPISAVAWSFLALLHYLQDWVYQDLPHGVGLDPAPWWWPLPVLTVAGVLVALTVRYLPGGGGHVAAEGFQTGGSESADRYLPGVCLAALASLGLGAVLGPEAPLIALGSGLAVLALHGGRQQRPTQTVALAAAVGSFAAISTLLGSPLIGAFLLMEVVGLSGPMLSLVLVPGLLAAGMGSLIFVGLGDWSGLGTLSLAIPDLPPSPSPDLGQFCWAVAIGVAGGLVGVVIKRLALFLDAAVRRRILLLTPVMGLAMAASAIAYAEATGRPAADVLFSGEEALGPLLTGSATYPVDVLLLLLVCKGLAYCAALASFRGGPIFPAMFLGAAGGILCSHLPGLPVVAGAAMGIGAMAVTLLRFPLTSVLLTTVFMGSDGLTLMPLVIVAVVVAFVVSARLIPPEPARGAPGPVHAD
jgi:H+/Cl- antiporter ClcA